MKPGAVLVDVAIDQGGCFETSRPTTHSDPIYEVDGIVHYCVANMPGAVPITSTKSLTNVTLPVRRGDREPRRSTRQSRASRPLARGVNVVAGKLTYQAVADAHGLAYTPLEQACSRAVLARRARSRCDGPVGLTTGSVRGTARRRHGRASARAGRRLTLYRDLVGAGSLGGSDSSLAGKSLITA